MATALGLLGLLAFIVGVIALAAGVTWMVIRLTPQRETSETSAS